MKLAPKFYGPFPILAKRGKVAYQLQLTPESRIHSTFHVSLLKKAVGQEAVVMPNLPPTDSDGQFIVELIAVIDRRLIQRNRNVVSQGLIQWANGLVEDATWEDWSTIKARFPEFAANS